MRKNVSLLALTALLTLCFGFAARADEPAAPAVLEAAPLEAIVAPVEIINPTLEEVLAFLPADVDLTFQIQLHGALTSFTPAPVNLACTPTNWCASCSGRVKYCERFSNCSQACYACVGC